MKRAKIAFHSENCEDIGGSDLYMARLIRGITCADWEPIVVVRPGYPLDLVFRGDPAPILHYGKPCAPRAGPHDPHTEHAPIVPGTPPLGTVYRKTPDSFRKMLGLTRCTLAQKHLLRRAGVRLVHTMDGGPQPMAVAGALAGCKVVMSYSAAPPDTRQSAATRFWDQRAYHSATVCVAPSQYAKDAWACYLCNDGAKIQVLPHGVKEAPPTQGTGVDRASLGLAGQDRVICYVGRLAPEKGPDLLLDAMPRILEHIPTAKLVLIGDGAFRPELERRALAQGLAGSVRLLGFRQNVQELMQLADVIVIPSSRMYETFGLAALEAMSSGRAVIAANRGAVPEVVLHEETGLLVDTGDCAQIAQAVLRVLSDDRLRERLGNAGKARARRDFSDEITLGRYYSLYKSLLP